jgi:hypothetical protein
MQDESGKVDFWQIPSKDDCPKTLVTFLGKVTQIPHFTIPLFIGIF